jgi:hypothetical protein
MLQFHCNWVGASILRVLYGAPAKIMLGSPLLKLDD